MNVGDWLRSLGLGQYEATFRDNEIDADVLSELTDGDLEKLGVPLGHRKRLLKAIAAPGALAPAPSAATPRAQDAAAERRQLTVMFVDLVGSTALSARLDPEDLRGIIGAYHRCCAQVIERHGGFVAKYMGDGVLVYFGYPQAHEDDAERAVRAGLELVAAVAALKTDAALETRVGIATGLVVVGDLIGSGEAQERGIVGETPNLAARLQDIAAPNRVVIAADTRRLLGDLFELEDLGARDLKGIAGPVRAFAALRASAVESRFEALHAFGLTALVGREEEAELLLRRWARAKSGDGQVVLLSGEAGIGKSRLTAALLERLAGEPHTRLRYFCSPQHTDSALHPIIGQIERAAAWTREDGPQQKLDKLDALLARTATAKQDATLFAELLSLANDGRYPALGLDPQQRRQKTLEALLAQIEVLARQNPVLMIFEDAHWSDPTSLELFGRAVDRIAGLRALLIVTLRPEFAPPWIGRPHVTALTINRLARRDVDAMIDRVVGNKALPVGIRADIIERTDGIPLFVEEMTKAVLEAEREGEAGRIAAAVPSPALAVPASLHASLMARLDRLGPAKEVAQIGAAIGREFSHAVLAAIMPKSEAELQSALDGLIAAGLLFRQGLPPHATYLFKHALVQDAAYGTLLRGSRRQLHGRIAAALESRFPDIVGAQPHLMAQHCAEAGFDEKAVGYWLKAGEQALARSAMREAETLLRKGLALIPRLADGVRRQELELDLQIALGRVLSQTLGFHAPPAGEAYARARQLCDELKRPRKLTSVLYGQWINSLVGADLKRAGEFAAEMLRLGEAADDIVARVVGCRASGATSLFLGDFPAARARLERGLELYDPTQRAVYGDMTSVDTRVALLGYLAHTLACCGELDQARSNCEEALAEARSAAHAPTLAHILWNRWLTGWLVRSDPAALLPYADELLALSADRELMFWNKRSLECRGWCLAMLGAGEEGVSLLNEGLAYHGATSLGPFILTMLADAYRVVGQPELGLARLAEAERLAEATHNRLFQCEMLRLRGVLLALIGDRVTGAANLRDAIALAQRQGAKLFELRAARDLAGLWRDQGKGNAARDLLASIYRRFTEGFDTPDLQEAKALLDKLA